MCKPLNSQYYKSPAICRAVTLHICHLNPSVGTSFPVTITLLILNPLEPIFHLNALCVASCDCVRMCWPLRFLGKCHFFCLDCLGLWSITATNGNNKCVVRQVTVGTRCCFKDNPKSFSLHYVLFKGHKCTCVQD